MVDELRDWQPGDGLRCVFATRAPRGIPCGPPVKTRVVEIYPRPGSRQKTAVRRALCSNHIQLGGTPSKLRAQADRIARERLLHAHWDEYEKYLAEEITKAVERYKEAQNDG